MGFNNNQMFKISFVIQQETQRQINIWILAE